MSVHNLSTSRFHGLPNEENQSPRAWVPYATSTAAPELAARYDDELRAARPQIIKATFVEGNLLEILISPRISAKRRSPQNFQRNVCLLTVVLLPPSLPLMSSSPTSETLLFQSSRSPSSLVRFHLLLTLLFSFNASFFSSTTSKFRKVCITILPRHNL